MSRTLKDRPYDVEVKKGGFVEHNHSSGTCVVGTMKELQESRRQRAAHRKACPRNSYMKTCVHDAKRQTLQDKVSNLRNKQKAYALIIDDAYRGTPFVPSRAGSARAIEEMIEQGYLPNCIETKTHVVDISDYDFRLIPGESIDRHRPRIARMLAPKHDASIPCDFCDNNPEITCIYTTAKSNSRKYVSCSCCTDLNKRKYPQRATTRDEMKTLENSLHISCENAL